MSDPGPKYHYRSDVEELAAFIEEHHDHFVLASGTEWLRCHSCGRPIRITDGRRAGVVLLEEFGR